MPVCRNIILTSFQVGYFSCFNDLFPKEDNAYSGKIYADGEHFSPFFFFPFSFNFRIDSRFEFFPVRKQQFQIFSSDFFIKCIGYFSGIVEVSECFCKNFNEFIPEFFVYPG